MHTLVELELSCIVTQMSRIVIESKTPTWQKGNLRMTRIKDDARGEILLFKEAEWQTLRIEANALEGSDCDLNTTPLRLIANQSKIRITMKKRLIGELGSHGLEVKQFPVVYFRKYNIEQTSSYNFLWLCTYKLK